MSSSLQVLLLGAMLILFAKIFGSIAARMSLPLVFGELFAGVLLGPTVLNIGMLPCFTPATGSNGVSVFAILKVLGGIGVVLLMFLAGLETDITMMRSTIAPAFWAALGGVLLPAIGGCLLSRYAGSSWREAIFIGTILTATSVTITAQTLTNLQQLRSRSGSTILGAAVIDDVLGLTVLSLVIVLSARLTPSPANAWTGFTLTLSRMGLCLVILFWGGPPLARWVLAHAGERLHGPHMEVAAALFIAFLFAFQTEWLGGMAAITGSYLAGLFVAGTPARGRVIDDLHPMIHSFFAPLFFVSIGLEVNAWQLGGRLRFFLLLLAVAVLGKILGSGFGARLNGFNNRDSLVVGLGMIPRGEVGLVTASIGWAAGLVSQTVYVQVIVVVLVTTLITPALLKLALPYRRVEASIGGRAVVEIHKLHELPAAVADTVDA